PMEICHEPMDVICSDAGMELLAYGIRKPVILAETGAVEPRHSGPSQYYAKDTAGIILHDALFAPFFSGAAGAGMIWHWDQYVAKNNLWHHFNRFAQAVKGLNPVKEQFKPFYFETNALRVYGLRGKQTFLLWCRDKENSWQTELRDDIAPRTIHRAALPLSPYLKPGEIAAVQSFDPWRNEWQQLDSSDNITLPDFQRSVVLRGKIR
ncbi:MAG TPA: hypothetical protein VF490_15840, partial [Chryseosolibacter sp.]